MRISAMTFPALLCAPIALFALAAIASRSGIWRAEESEFPTLLAQSGVERIPLRAGGVRGNEERTLSRLPPGSRSGARDLLFRPEEHAGFGATQPFLLPPESLPRTSSAEEYRRFLQKLRSGAKRTPDAQDRLQSQIRSGRKLDTSPRYLLVKSPANKP